MAKMDINIEKVGRRIFKRETTADRETRIVLSSTATEEVKHIRAVRINLREVMARVITILAAGTVGNRAGV